MTEFAASQHSKIFTTPLRDLLRGRITGRLDWKSRLESSGLPVPAMELISRVVKRTRLWRLEKAAVADELTAHFLDGVDSGSNAEELVRRFGDERIAAGLIRRAKQRGRPRAWKAARFLCRSALVVVITWWVIYGVSYARFCIGGPAPSVDYVAQADAHSARPPAGEQAWPVWSKAFDSVCHDQLPEAYLQDVAEKEDKKSWDQMMQWLARNQAGIKLARRAGEMPVLGGVSVRGSDVDLSSGCAADRLLAVWYDKAWTLREMSHILSLDARHAAEIGDGASAAKDLLAMLGAARQLHDCVGLIVIQQMGDGVRLAAVRWLVLILSQHPDLFSDPQLIQLAHARSGPKVAADLMDVSAERYCFADGAVVGIALERYHRMHGSYPVSLTALTPEFLSEVPIDRITGNPVKYRLIGGKPVVYSVGADLVDDGGKPADNIFPWPLGSAAASWEIKPPHAPRGDWVLYPE